MEKKKVQCSTISVDCCHNDPVDIRCGGPEYLGFDFYVDKREVQKMMHFLIVTIEQLHCPLMNISIGEDIVMDEDQVWTKERILASIAKSVEELQEEARRSYNADLDLRPRM